MSKSFWPLAALALIFAAGGFAAATYWRNRTAPTADVALASGTLIQPQRDLGEFALLNQNGSPFGPDRLRGAWSLLYFGYTNCPDVCPTTLATLAAMKKQLRGANGARDERSPRVFFVSVDAQRDTPERLAQYVPYFDPQFVGVTAKDQKTIEEFARKMGVAVLITPTGNGVYTVDHSSAIFLVAPNGKLDAIFTAPFRADALANDVRKLMSARR